MTAQHDHAAACYPDLAGQVILVTGGTGGIGAPLSHALAAQGARVAVNSRNEAAAVRTAAEIVAAGGTAIAAAADCTREDQLSAMARRVTAGLGPPDAVACFAGGALTGSRAFHEMSAGEWDTVIRGNLTATFLTMKTFLPAMMARQRGAVVTVASAAGRIPTQASAPYTVAKAGIVALTRHVAQEAAGHGIRVNCISPSVVLTERNNPGPGVQRDMTRQHPLGRLGQSQDVVSAALFLLSDASGWVTGITLDVAGGRVMV